MKVEFSNEKGVNSIWLSDDKDSNVINIGKVVVTDEKLHEQLVNRLRDFYSYYKSSSRTLIDSCRPEMLLYTLDGAQVFHKSIWVDNYDRHGSFAGHTYNQPVDFYQNPKAGTFRLITGNLLHGSYSLLDLFDYTDCNVKDFELLSVVIQLVNAGAIDVPTLKRLIYKMWPDFGCYATKGLGCTDIEIVQSHNVDELNDILKTSQKSSVIREVNNILKHESLARDNSKVLKLARQVHHISSK